MTDRLRFLIAQCLVALGAAAFAIAFQSSLTLWYRMALGAIILVDFIELRLRDGLPLEQAVVDAGAVRFRPMALTAAAVIVEAGVILFDPIFRGSPFR